MSKLVVDSSIVLTWIGLQNQHLSDPASTVFKRAKTKKLLLLAPEFLLVELINVLKWRHKWSGKNIARATKIIQAAGIKFVPLGPTKTAMLTELVEKYNLTAYDALFLLTAIENDCQLLTTDPQLLTVKNWCLSLKDLTTLVI